MPTNFNENRTKKVMRFSPSGANPVQPPKLRQFKAEHSNFNATEGLRHGTGVDLRRRQTPEDEEEMRRKRAVMRRLKLKQNQGWRGRRSHGKPGPATPDPYGKVRNTQAFKEKYGYMQG